MKIPDLILPKSGGTVRFRDDDDLRGKDYRRLRSYVLRDRPLVGDAGNHAGEMAAALLVVEWDIPSLPNLPLPSIRQDGTVDPGGLDLLPWQDLSALDDAVMPFANEALYGRTREAAAPLAGAEPTSTPDPSSA